MFAYSDVPQEHVMHLASLVLAAGARFTLARTNETQLATSKPVVAVAAVRTGCGKSQVARYLSVELQKMGLRVAALRHPMPYGQLQRQAVKWLRNRQTCIDATGSTSGGCKFSRYSGA